MIKILSVIVLYKTSLSQSKTYSSLLCNKSIPIYIYDNSPEAQEIDHKLTDDIVYTHNPLNPGLSYAYNKAAEFAKNNGFEWILILDQDTIFPENIISDYENSIFNNPDLKLFAPRVKVQSGKYLSPSHVRNHVTSLSTKAPTGITSLWKYIPINSGMMVNLDAFLAVGGYNEKVRLDFSDYQFIERFRTHFNNFFVLQSVCIQEFSNEVHTTQQLISRYRIFCDCIKNCNRKNIKDEYMYFWIVVKRALSLTIRTRNLNFIYIFIKYYL